jgi:biopolymer transport protein ExbD
MRSHDSPEALGNEAVRADINVTPLVDICLVLLIIFMVVTPLLREGVEVALPEAARPEPIPERGGQIVISIRGDRSVWLGDQRVEPKDLVLALERVQVPSPEHAVLVRGDRSLPYGEVRAVFKRLTEAGVTRATLVTLKEGQKSGS